MRTIQAFAMAAILAGLSAGAATADDWGKTGQMATGAMAKDDMALSKADMKIADACKKMAPEKAARTAKCQRLAKAHPGAMGAMATGSMSTQPMSSTAAMSSGQMANPSH
ncbi:MAG TPA: hypothetical protein VFN88_13275 [Caulobacteraceae bacterium]|nr:hypothetical protein [Caulobacteraceae bacterium]